MFKRLTSILLGIGVVMIFTAQTYRLDDKKQQMALPAKQVAEVRPAAEVRSAPEAKPQVQSRPEVQKHQEAPSRPQVQYHPQVQTRREVPVQNQIQPAHQERETPRVLAVQPPAPVENNRLLHREHHNNWKPRYNFYGNQYHFYPYVNIAATVELSEGYVVTGPDGQNYYYDQGTFYLQDPQTGQYVAVPPPIGIIVNPIAAGARQISVNGQVYWRYKGIFYVQIAQGYQVIGPVQEDPGS